MEYQDKVAAFLTEKQPKYVEMIKMLMKIPEVSLSKDIAYLTTLLLYVRQYLNVAVQLMRNVELLQGSVRELKSDLEFIMVEKKVECLCSEEWISKNVIAKMSKEERDMKAAFHNADLNRAIHNLAMFEEKVDALKRAAASKREDMDRVRRDVVAMIWGVRTEEFLNGKLINHTQEEINKFLTTGIKDVDEYLNITKRG
jgi:hypothetical protein